MPARRRPVANRARRSRGVRIIAGDWRSRRIPVADAPGLRPTPDRVRETLFNWLAPVIAGARVLDLYAGSGVLAFEALSRGAASAVLVERDARLAATLRETSRLLGATHAQVVHADAPGWLRVTRDAFDIVFLDPPFDRPDLLTEALELLRAGGLLTGDARVHVETPAVGEWAVPAGWRVLRERRAGDVRHALLAPGPDETSA